MQESFHCQSLTPDHNAALASLIRRSLKAHQLDIPGTVYFDPGLDQLSDSYSAPDTAYLVLLQNGQLVGGIGLAPFAVFSNCCELQKLYLDESVQGQGLGYELIDFIEDKARELGYQKIYLETHSNLQAAMHIYEKAGYQEIPRPASVVHSTMDHFYLKGL